MTHSEKQQIKILTFSTLYPNAVMPRHGIFVENRLRQLVSSGKATSRVMAPVPFFPFKSKIFGEYAKYSRVPQQECRFGIDVVHPRYPHLPKISMNLAPAFMAKSALGSLEHGPYQCYDFDLIDAHYFYPDGVAAAKIAAELKKPFVITARGSDINLIAEYPKPREMILAAADAANAVITVSQSLKQKLMDIGVKEDKIRVLRNGVDLKQFSPPKDRVALRKSLGFEKYALISVGNLIPLKGHDLIIRALAYLPDIELFVIGEGPELPNLKQIAAHTGVASQVKFIGHVPHDELARYYGAADVLVLASSREGWANVLLESMACGTPVVATRVGGNPEVVASTKAGVLVERTVESITNGIKRILDNNLDRSMVRNYAEQFSWDNTTSGQLELFSRIFEN